ncbi:MAG: hypothetical protein FWD73_04780 [Polyangiaceae bacterium]|nr:hypothetical protein [Polyangiaceae bacterium]
MIARRLDTDARIGPAVEHTQIAPLGRHGSLERTREARPDVHGCFSGDGATLRSFAPTETLPRLDGTIERVAHILDVVARDGQHRQRAKRCHAATNLCLAYPLAPAIALLVGIGLTELLRVHVVTVVPGIGAFALRRVEQHPLFGLAHPLIHQELAILVLALLPRMDIEFSALACRLSTRGRAVLVGHVDPFA